jgi:hypothetical protein
MQIRLTLSPGQKGTKKLLAQYGDQLVCVRYRYDQQRQKRIKTVELVIEETDWVPKPKGVTGRTLVGVRIGYSEMELRERVKHGGGRWNKVKRLWEIRYEGAKTLGLEERIVEWGSI